MAHKDPSDAVETGSDFLATGPLLSFLGKGQLEAGTSSTSKDVYQDGAALSEDTETLKDFILCRRCCNKFDRDVHRPFLLPCLDGLCKLCALNLRAAGKTSYECVKCLVEHKVIKENKISLQIDPLRKVLSEIYSLKNGDCSIICEMCTKHQTASHRCVDCSYFICTDCVNLHKTLKQFVSHVILEIQRLLTDKIQDLRLLFSANTKKCPVYGHEKENVKVFCSSPSCMKPICFLCAISTHKEHRVVDISIACKERECDIENEIQKILKKTDHAEKSLAWLEDLDEKYLQNSQDLQTEIKTYFGEAKEVLEKKEKRCLDVLSAQIINIQTLIENERKRLTSFVRSCDQACNYGRWCSEFNNVESFLDVAESIHSRFINLEEQLLDSQIPTVAIKFSPEPAVTLLNNFGKLSVSKAISSESKVSVTPSICELHRKVQFQIQLFASLGKPIVDEDVYVYLELDGKTFKYLQCFIDQDASSSCQAAQAKNEKPSGKEINVFQSEFGKMPFVQEGKDRDEIRMDLEKLGCTVDFTEKNCFRIKGNLSKITNVSKLLRELGKKTEPLDNESFFNMITIAMSERDYNVLMHFGDKRDWFKQYRNSINFDGHCLACVVPTNGSEKVIEDIQKHLQEVRQMSSVCDHITVEFKESIQDLAKQNPDVYLFVNDKSIEIISDSYEDIVKLQDMLKPKKIVRTNRRFARTFAKNDNAENQGALSPSNDVYNGAGKTLKSSTFTSQTTTQSGTLEIKTAEGLLIKVYTGSITKLNVDCIVNAANENLMHGGGVAAAISEAAGYQFDKESAQYIADNGPLPVGSCCVTSAGKLPFKCVIHTVGPRWSDYRDSNVCLEILQKSVEVTLKTADKEGMSSVAIPAISSGVYGVPRDKCAEQHCKAAMSFCNTYKCKSLREIHFVDKDALIIESIIEVFKHRVPISVLKN